MDNLRTRTKINISEYPYSDNFSDPIIIKTFNNFVEKFSAIAKDTDYLIIRINYLQQVLIDIVSPKNKIAFEKEVLEEILIRLIIDGIYLNHQYLFGQEYLEDKVRIYDKIVNYYASVNLFTQSYPESRFQLYREMITSTKPFSYHKVICLGGDVMAYNQIISAEDFINFTNCETIYYDCKHNHCPINLVDYESFEINEYFKYPDLLIINIGRNGTKPKLMNLILNEIQPQQIIYIGCSISKVIKDIDQMIEKYDIINELTINCDKHNNIYYSHLSANKTILIEKKKKVYYPRI